MRSIMSIALSSVFVAAALVACGGSTASGGGGGTGTVSGAVSGTSFTPVSAFAAFQAAGSSTNCEVSPDGGSVCTASSSSGQALLIALTNQAAGSCSALVADITSKQEPSIANLDALALIVANEAADLTPGTYPVVTTGNPTSGSLGEFQTTTATCGVGVSQQSTGGSVTLTSVSASAVAGSYSVTFGTEGTLSGTFNVDICAIPEGGLSDKVTSTGCTQ